MNDSTGGRFTLTAICFAFISAVSFLIADETAFMELAERSEALAAEFRSRDSAAMSDEERNDLYNRLHPDCALVDDWIAVEAGHRGEPAAVSALVHLFHNAGKTGDFDSPASRGRVRGIEILKSHYLNHPDLDLMLSGFLYGAFVPEAEELLRKAGDSPHQHVRAAAEFQLARFLHYKVQYVEHFGSDSDPPRDSPLIIKWHRKCLRLAEQLEPLDRRQQIQEARALLRRLADEATEIPLPRFQFEGPGKLVVRRLSPDELPDGWPTYAMRAESLHNELTYLQPGQVAPEIVGTDAAGNQFRLSEYRGRVVLLLFSAGWCAPCKAMYPELRQLQQELADRPFTVLAVMGDRKLSDVTEAVERGDITWRTWFDGADGPIAKSWNVRGLPTLFLIDREGVIQDKFSRDLEAVRRRIDPLL